VRDSSYNDCQKNKVSTSSLAICTCPTFLSVGIIIPDMPLSTKRCGRESCLVSREGEWTGQYDFTTKFYKDVVSSGSLHKATKGGHWTDVLTESNQAMYLPLALTEFSTE
jgi:hypothetical protein